MRLLQNETIGTDEAPELGLLFSVGVLISGAAGLINEVVWQRALQRFLGGSETLSSMLVVAAFMLGLGLGSIIGGRCAGRFRQPLRALATVEAALAVTTLVIAVGFGSSASNGILDLQLSAVHAGLPVTVVFGCLALIVLFVPCFLMGATMPLSSEACQRALGHQNSRALGMLFGVNTLGAAAGALIAGFRLIPLYGISSSLFFAVALNVLAAVFFMGVRRTASLRREAAEPSGTRAAVADLSGGGQMGTSALTMLGLGFCSLGYEMSLFRLFALKWTPLPYTFAIVITWFLLAWSAGAALSSRVRIPNLSRVVAACALALLLPVAVYYLWWHSAGSGIADSPPSAIWIERQLDRILTGVCFVPCGLFGFLFGAITVRAARAWGRDVGGLYAANTVGAVAGVVAIPLVGYELPFPVLLAGVIGILFILQNFENQVYSAGFGSRPSVGGFRRLTRVVALGGAATVTIGAAWTASSRFDSSLSLWFSRAGVLGLDRGGNLFWDGLWHSRLADGNSYIGTNNWNLAALPAVSYSGPAIRDVCVIGLGTGITAAVIAKLTTVRKVDIYEINRGLEAFHRRYSDGTLHVLDNPKIDVRWQDARAGLRIREDRYDLIITQPMYLKQAGSTFLNSREFLEIVRSRLNPRGVFCLYSRGTEEQKLVMRQTAASVFRHGESFLDGYELVLSTGTLDVSEETLRRRFLEFHDDALWREVAANPETESPEAVRSALDHPRLNWSAWGLNLTDDDPLVEYPELIATRLKWAEEAAH